MTWQFYYQSESESPSVVSHSLRPHELYSPWNSPGQNMGVGSHSLSPGDLPDPGIQPGSPALQANSLPSELPGKPKSYLYIDVYEQNVIKYSEDRSQLKSGSTYHSST